MPPGQHGLDAGFGEVEATMSRMFEVEGKLTEAAKKRIDGVVFGWFASAYPHEAAEYDWPQFTAYARKRTKRPDLTEEEMSRVLRRT